MSGNTFDRSRDGEQRQNAPLKSGSRRIALLAAMAAWAVGLRGTLDLVGEVRYWNPQTALDYTAVVLTSIAFLLAGCTFRAIGGDWRDSTAKTGRMARFSRYALATAAIAAVVISISNFLEDFLRLRWFGTTFVAGSLVLFAALLAATVARFAAMPRKEISDAVLLLGITAGIIASPLSAFPACAAFLAVAAYYAFGLPRWRGHQYAARA